MRYAYPGYYWLVETVLSVKLVNRAANVVKRPIALRGAPVKMVFARF